MAYNTFRSKDMEAERELAKFLDKHLYSRDIFTRSERTDNAATQIDGSDIILTTYRFFYTQTLAEKPVIILLNKEEYIRMGEFHYFLRP